MEPLQKASLAVTLILRTVVLFSLLLQALPLIVLGGIFVLAVGLAFLVAFVSAVLR